MLKIFEVQNFKSFNSNFVFNLSETKNYEFNQECIRDGVVNKAMIYGVNGCGKSNLGLAIFDIISHLTDKTKVPALYSNFLNADSVEKMATFKYHFNFNGTQIEYRYGKAVYGIVSWETLLIDGKEVITYQQGKPFQSTLKGTETLNSNLGDYGLSTLKYIKNNAKLANNKANRALKSLFKFVDEMLFFRSLMLDHNYLGYTAKYEDILQYILSNNHLSEFELFLNESGVNCKLEQISRNGSSEIVFAYKDKVISFWEASSTGTKSLALCYYWLLNAKDRNDLSFVFIDEFDAFYHHRLSTQIVKILKGIPAQVVLTTHNTSIMTSDLMRPDCYFLMQGNQMQPLYKFTDKELRVAHNIEKMYKAGAFDV